MSQSSTDVGGGASESSLSRCGKTRSRPRRPGRAADAPGEAWEQAGPSMPASTYAGVGVPTGPFSSHTHASRRFGWEFWLWTARRRTSLADGGGLFFNHSRPGAEEVAVVELLLQERTIAGVEWWAPVADGLVPPRALAWEPGRATGAMPTRSHRSPRAHRAAGGPDSSARGPAFDRWCITGGRRSDSRTTSPDSRAATAHWRTRCQPHAGPVIRTDGSAITSEAPVSGTSCTGRRS